MCGREEIGRELLSGSYFDAAFFLLMRYLNIIIKSSYIGNGWAGAAPAINRLPHFFLRWKFCARP